MQNNKQNSQDQRNQSVTIEEKPKIKSWIVIIIILSILIIIGVTVFVIKNVRNKKTDNLGKTEQNTSLISIKPGYRLYINKVYGFSFEYPENFIFEPDISSESPETSMLVMLEENKLFKDVNPSEKHRSVLVGHSKGVNKETCETHSDSFNDVNQYLNANPTRYKFKKINSSFLDGQIDGLLIQNIIDNSLFKKGYRNFLEIVYPLCLNNKFFEIRFHYNSAYTPDEIDKIEQNKFKTDFLNSFKFLNKSELVSPPIENKFSDEEQEVLNRFNSEILPSNLSIKEELKDKQITQIFRSGEIFVIRTEPKRFVKTNYYDYDGGIKIYAVNKDSFLVLAEDDIVDHIDKLYSPVGLETKRLIVQLRGGAHVSFLYLLDITSEIKIIKFSDPKNYSIKLRELTKNLYSIEIRNNGSIHAEQFDIEDKTINIFETAMGGEWKVYLTFDLESGKLTKTRFIDEYFSKEVIFDN